MHLMRKLRDIWWRIQFLRQSRFKPSNVKFTDIFQIKSETAIVSAPQRPMSNLTESRTGWQRGNAAGSSFGANTWLANRARMAYGVLSNTRHSQITAPSPFHHLWKYVFRNPCFFSGNRFIYSYPPHEHPHHELQQRLSDENVCTSEKHNYNDNT